jgi:hypothetical protein
MFKCEITGKFSKPGDKVIRLVTQKRERFYFEVKDRIEDESTDPIGTGWEIVKEINVTLEGLHQWVLSHPEDVDSAVRYGELFRAEQNKKRAALKEGQRDETT